MAAIAVGVAGRSQGTWLFRLCLGIAAVGITGLVEAQTSSGLGLEAGQLAIVAVIFGILDVVLGSVLHRVTPGS